MTRLRVSDRLDGDNRHMSPDDWWGLIALVLLLITMFLAYLGV